MNLVVLPGASRELEDAAAFYEARREGLGAKFMQRINSALDQICEAPERHPLWRTGSDIHRLRVKVFPYQVVYAIEPDTIVVIAFAATAQRPGYWLGRVR